MPTWTWRQLLGQLIAGQDLSAEQTAWASDQIMAGECSPVQVAGFLVALRAKGESVAELTGLVDGVLAHAVPLKVPGPCVDVVGTGGDGAHTVNISTMAALVVAGAGTRVVKHGNRAASSACGSADVLEHLGVRLDLSPDAVARVAEEAGITFCFAQVFHPSFRHAAVARRELGVPTAFNIMGPLTNPAQPRAAAVGVADRRMAPLVAGVLAARGTSALVFRGEDGLDELATSGPSTVWQARAGQVVEQQLDPADLGVPRSPVSALAGGDAAFNAQVVRDVLGGAPGAARDAVLLNAAAALVAADAADDVLPGEVPAADVAAQATPGPADLSARIGAALERAAHAVDSGAAAAVLDRWVRATTSA